jgi:hypothetical protein
VNVKLVENIEKSHDGKVRVVNVMIQNRTLGMTLKKKSMSRTKRPSHVLGVGKLSGSKVDVLVAAAVELEAVELSKLVIIEDIFSEAAVTRGSRMDERLTAISAHQCSGYGGPILVLTATESSSVVRRRGVQSFKTVAILGPCKTCVARRSHSRGT